MAGVVAVAVGVGARVADRDGVLANVGVFVGVLVAAGVFVAVLVGVAVFVGVLVDGVTDGVSVAVTEGSIVGLDVDEGVTLHLLVL